MPHIYSNRGKIYSVDMMMAYINLYNPPSKKIKIANLLHELDYEGWGNDVGEYYSAKTVIGNPDIYAADYARIKTAKLSYPIIVCNKNIVDGVHRLAKAYLDNKKEIAAYIFSEKLMQKFMINSRGDHDKAHQLPIHKYIELFYARFGRPK